jgi:hypothetical protein
MRRRGQCKHASDMLAWRQGHASRSVQRTARRPNERERTPPLQGIGSASARGGAGPLLEAAALTDRGGDALEVGPPFCPS